MSDEVCNDDGKCVLAKGHQGLHQSAWTEVGRSKWIDEWT